MGVLSWMAPVRIGRDFGSLQGRFCHKSGTRPHAPNGTISFDFCLLQQARQLSKQVESRTTIRAYSKNITVAVEQHSKRLA